MLTKEKKNFNALFCLALILLLASIIGLLLLNPKEAGAATVAEMTGTDQKNGFTIQDYAGQVNSHSSLQGALPNVTNGAGDSLFGKNVEWYRLDYGYSALHNLKLYGDDPVVEIVPRAYFKTVFDKPQSYLGKEYGFYIDCVYKSGGYYESDVLIVDVKNSINNSLGNLDNPTASSFTVVPIFQSKYIFVPRSGCSSVSLMRPGATGGAVESYSVGFGSSANADGCVAPLPKITGTLVYYDSRALSYEKEVGYKLQDVSFAGALSNTYALNSWDNGYHANNDKGGYFVGIFYRYPGTATVSGKTQSEVIWGGITDFVIGGILDAYTNFGFLYGLASTTISASSGYFESSQQVTIDLSNPEYNSYTRYATTSTHSLNISIHGGNLLKYFHAVINAENRPTIRFGTNQIAEAEFAYHTIGDPGYGGMQYATDLHVGIGFKVVKGNEVKTGMTATQKHRVINGPGQSVEASDSGNQDWRAIFSGTIFPHNSTWQEILFFRYQSDFHGENEYGRQFRLRSVNNDGYVLCGDGPWSYYEIGTDIRSSYFDTGNLIIVLQNGANLDIRMEYSNGAYNFYYYWEGNDEVDVSFFNIVLEIFY